MSLKRKGIDVPLTNKVDVFSYGLILYFMIFRNHAFVLQQNKTDFVAGRINIPQDKTIPQSIIELMKRCLDPNPETRISFEDIIKSPFLTKLEINSLPTKYVFKENAKIPYEGSSSIGFVDPTKQYWVKLYKQAAVANKDYLKYIEREINFLERSKLVPHIAQMIDFGKYENKIAILFNFCNGGTLYSLFEDRIKELNIPKSNAFSLDEIKLVARCLIEFIDGMHGKNNTHRAINPTHILVKLNLNKKIEDIQVCGFRSSKSENLPSGVTCIISDVRYFDPTAEAEGFSEESDLWSIGMVIYFMSTGLYPTDDNQERCKIRATGKINFPKNVDKSIQEFIEFCIRKRPRGSISQLILLEAMNKEGIMF